MNYKFQTLMAMIMYVKTGFWKVEKRNDYAEDKELVKSKFEDIFKNELVRECYDATHVGNGLYKYIGTVTIFGDFKNNHFKVVDNYNTLLSLYNGIYRTFEGKKLCLDTKAHGLRTEYFKYCETEGGQYTSIESIVNGTCEYTPNVRRMISILFSRDFQYLENYNPDQFMFFDYSEEEKEKIVKESKKFYEKPTKKKITKDEE